MSTNFSAAFEGYLKAEDWLARSGQMSDVTIAPVPKQRHNPDENAPIKAGETLQGRDEKPAKNRQEDTNARWTKNNGKSL